MQLQIDMARSLNEFSDTRQTGEVLAQQVYAWASRAAEANAQSVAYEFHRADAALELGIAKLGRGQLNEAFELISQAESSFGYLLLPDMMTQLTEQLFNGRIAILYRLCMCKYHLARIGYSLHDRQFAINMAVQLDEMLSKESDISSDSVEPALLKWSNRITLIRLGAIGDGEQGSVGKLKEILNEVSKRVEARPNHRGLLQLQLAAWTEMAKVNYWRGRLDLAQADIASALEARDAMKANASTSIAVRTLESELAQIKSDVDQLCNHNLP